MLLILFAEFDKLSGQKTVNNDLGRWTIKELFDETGKYNNE